MLTRTLLLTVCKAKGGKVFPTLQPRAVALTLSFEGGAQNLHKQSRLQRDALWVSELSAHWSLQSMPTIAQGVHVQAVWQCVLPL